MRVAVCMSGEMRGFSDRCRNSLIIDVFKPFMDRGDEVDLFVHTRSDQYLGLAIYKLGARVLCIEANRPISTSIIISDKNPKEQGDYEDPTRGRRAFLYQSYLQQYWSLKRVGQLLWQTEVRDGDYDLVIRTRPDCYLKSPLRPETLLDGKVHVPYNDWWPYEVDGRRVETVCDKFAVGPTELMRRYFSKFDVLHSFCKYYRLQGESFTAWCLEDYRWVCDGEPIPWVRDSNIEISQDPKAYQNCERP